MKKIYIALAIFVAVTLAGGIWFWREQSEFLHTAPEAQGREVYFDVAPGARLPQIACDLVEKGLITDAQKFTWLARLKNQDKRLKAGRFALNSGWTPEKTLDALVNGAPVLFRVTIPEGLTWWQTAQILQNAGLVRVEDFRDAIHDPEFLRHYGIPFASAEGFLMPDTYLLRKLDIPYPDGSTADADAPEQARAREAWRAQARAVAGRMIDNFWHRGAAIWPYGAKEETLSDEARKNRIPGEDPPRKYTPPAREDLRRWVILASIVEKETGIDEERGRVAGVYANRLRRNMLLQADPTVIYGLGEGFRGELRKMHLEDTGNAYNTYQRTGLPPGPICSFGTAALKAAVNPEKHDYLYFVAITDRGGHAFSRTYEDHNRAVMDYRRQKKAK